MTHNRGDTSPEQPYLPGGMGGLTPGPGEPVIELSHVSAVLQDREVLSDVSLTVMKGDFYAVIGPNGGGKTTLLRVLLGLVPPVSGTIRIFGDTPRSARHRMGYVPQFRTYDFRFPITVRSMVLSGRLGGLPGLTKRYRNEDIGAAADAMAQMDLLSLADREIRQLSGGEQQRAMIARALAAKPEILLLDEPTVYVDAPTELQFMDVLDGMRDKVTIVLVTHDVGVISDRVTRVACLNRRVYTHGTNEITDDMLLGAYQCPVELVAHGLPHRVLRDHQEAEK